MPWDDADTYEEWVAITMKHWVRLGIPLTAGRILEADAAYQRLSDL